MKISKVAYLGPEGTFANIVAKQRYGDHAEYIPKSSIHEVFDYVRTSENALGVVPIQNTSGGFINDTLDELLAENFEMSIFERIDLKVRLAAMGKAADLGNVKTLYSHFAPIEHCQEWIKSSFPQGIRSVEVSSTAEAAKRAASEKDAIALASEWSAKLYDLNVLDYPQQKLNLTQFFSISASHQVSEYEASSLNKSVAYRTTLSVRLKNNAGSLYDLLGSFANLDINLSRINSRPVPGVQSEYTFMIDVDGRASMDKNIQSAMILARQKTVSIKMLGEYPIAGEYNS
jgi:chorismate mutase / prephenate dehydratase